jgi:hypothetical protein
MLVQKSAGIADVNLMGYEMFFTIRNESDCIESQYRINYQEPRCGNTVS